MKYILKSVLAIFITGIFIAGCSEIEENIPQSPAISIHKDGIMNPSSDNFHGTVIRNNNWDMRDCRQCHAADYSGGIVGASCITCHSNPGGPEACNTCHGNFSDPSRIAPPRDISGNTSTSVASVGAHTNHLYENVLGNNVSCNTCHNVPASMYAEGHVDSDLPAEVIMQGIAKYFGADNAVYNPADATCSNTYCHGNFVFYRDSAKVENRFAYTSDKMTGNNRTVKWTKVDGSEKLCGSCHGLPPAGHIASRLTECYQCHQGVINPQGQIIDFQKHINGVKNSRGE